MGCIRDATFSPSIKNYRRVDVQVDEEIEQPNSRFSHASRESRCPKRKENMKSLVAIFIRTSADR